MLDFSRDHLPDQSGPVLDCFERIDLKNRMLSHSLKREIDRKLLVVLALLTSERNVRSDNFISWHLFFLSLVNLGGKLVSE